jgi:hypothetical protein
MIDFIQIQEHEFDEAKASFVHVIDETDPVVKKISALLDAFPCFLPSFKEKNATAFHHTHTSSSHKSQPAFGHKSKNHRKSHKHHEHLGNDSSMRKPIIVNARHKSNNERFTTALLNKLSRRNYATITQQILKFIDPDTINNFVSGVLDKCQKQSVFLELYINVLYDIYQKSDNVNKVVINTILMQYIDEFMSNCKFVDYQLNSPNYRKFCENMNSKKQIIGRHKTILALIAKILKNNMIDDYFNVMFNEIMLMDESANSVEFEETHERHELLLDIMSDFVKADAKYKSFIQKYYNAHVGLLQNYSTKARFKVMDITAMI